MLICDRGEGTGNTRRRPRGGAGRVPANSVSPPSNAVDPPPPKTASLEASPELSPRRPVVVPRSAPGKPHANSGTILQKDGHRGTPVTSAINPVDSLEHATGKISLRDDNDHPPSHKQARQRGRNRGRSNLSRQSSPQKTFQQRTSSEEHRSNRGISIGSPNLRGVLPITMPTTHASPRQDTAMPVVRLPETAPPPGSTQSHGTGNLIQSEDTDFGSDISRGAVREGRLYNHKTNEKLAMNSRARENQRSPRVKPVDGEKPEQPQRGVLRIQPAKLEPPKPQPPQQQTSGHRGGLLFIGNAIKPTTNHNNNNSKQNKPPPRGNEFNRNAVPLRKDAEPSSTRVIWNPDNISTNTLAHGGPPLKFTSEDVLREVKTAYQGIQTLERKVKSLHDSQDDIHEMTRLERRPTTEGVSWSSYAKTHRE